MPLTTDPSSKSLWKPPNPFSKRKTTNLSAPNFTTGNRQNRRTTNSFAWIAEDGSRSLHWKTLISAVNNDNCQVVGISASQHSQNQARKAHQESAHNRMQKATRIVTLIVRLGCHFLEKRGDINYDNCQITISITH